MAISVADVRFIRGIITGLYCMAVTSSIADAFGVVVPIPKFWANKIVQQYSKQALSKSFLSTKPRYGFIKQYFYRYKKMPLSFEGIFSKTFNCFCHTSLYNHTVHYFHLLPQYKYLSETLLQTVFFMVLSLTAFIATVSAAMFVTFMGVANL